MPFYKKVVTQNKLTWKIVSHEFYDEKSYEDVLAKLCADDNITIVNVQSEPSLKI